MLERGLGATPVRNAAMAAAGRRDFSGSTTPRTNTTRQHRNKVSVICEVVRRLASHPR